jgi:predicted PurR-regulated permease PerM
MNQQKNHHKFEKNSKYLTISIYTICVVLAGCIIFHLVSEWARTIEGIRHFLDVLSPFLIGLLIAYMMNPLIDVFYTRLFKGKLHIKRRRFFKIASVIIAYAIVLGALILCMTCVVPQLMISIAEITNSIPDMYSATMDRMTNLTKHGQNMSTPGLINIFINQNLPKAYSYIESFMGKSIPYIYDTSMQIIKVIVNFFIALIISIYLSFDKKIILHAIKRFIYAVLSPADARNAIVTFRECDQIFSSYLFGKAIDSIIIGILCFFLMSFFELPMAVLLSLIVGITNMIPYFGPFIGAIPGVILIGFLNPVGAVKFAILVFVLQQFDGYILGPRILGNSTGVRPVAILFAVIVGGAYFGVAGMFLGVPVFAVVQHLIGKWVEQRLQKKEINLI